MKTMSGMIKQAQDAGKVMDGMRSWSISEVAKHKFTSVTKSLENQKRLRKEIFVETTDRARKKNFITAYKTASGCAICGFNENPICLDLDHIDPSEKEFSISDLPKRSWKVILAEVAKCQVLCALCHRLKTEQERLSQIINKQCNDNDSI